MGLEVLAIAVVSIALALGAVTATNPKGTADLFGQETKVEQSTEKK